MTSLTTFIETIRSKYSVFQSSGLTSTESTPNSDCIITESVTNANQFMNNVDSATVFWNVSTRFSDGEEFGFGAEIGISTDKLHARGPMALRELTSYKYLISGKGQTKA